MLGINHFTWFDLFNRYGLIAAAGDRHLAEFMPETDYLKNPEVVESWGFGLTTVDWRKQDLNDHLEKSKCLASGDQAFTVEDSGEWANVIDNKRGEIK